MVEPVVFISHFRIKEGKLDAYRQLQRDATMRIQDEKPRTLAFLTYLDESSTRMTVVHVFADSESMDLHFEGAEERARNAYQFLEPEGWEIYGAPSDRAVEMMRRTAASAGTALTLQPVHVGGFLRLTSG